MTSAEHYLEAERLAEAYKSAVAEVEAMPVDTSSQRDAQFAAQSRAHALLTKAQVHATLSNAVPS